MDEPAHAFAVAWVARLGGRPLLVVTENARKQETLAADLRCFLPSVMTFPAWESLPQEDILPEEQTIAQRLGVLSSLLAEPVCFCIVASVQALMQRTFSPEAFRRAQFALYVGQSLERDALVERLVMLGYSRHVQVGEPGDMAVRGALVDFYPLNQPEPARVEFFGDRIESIRSFDPVTQQSRRKLERIEFAVAGEVGFLKKSPEHSAPLTAYLPRGTLLVLVEPDAVALAAEAYARNVPPADPLFVPWAEWCGAGYQTVLLTEQIAALEDDAHLNLRLASLEAFRPLTTLPANPEVAEQSRRLFFEQMARWLAEGWTLEVYCETEGERQRFEELCKERDLQPPLVAKRGSLSRGFFWEAAKLAVITDAEIFGRFKPRRFARADYATAPVADWSEFVEGDFVVHVQHGIGKFLGIRKLDGQEVLCIGYANDARLYVPLEQAHLVSRYVGLGKRIPPLHELGGTLWHRQKARAEQAIMDLASELLEIQAARATLPGHAFSPDTPWQREFEATFPYVETPDQLASIEDVKADMESSKPMDRLICGDVGFGKTEVAMRAAFKAVMDGMQVAVLCPTTVLAEQHWNVFRQRMAAFPVSVEMLSRFRTPAQQRDVLRRLREGGVDIVIGTHRLLSDDVSFKNLGLVIIDEEHRFGVLHKEKFKQYRKLVDVLTLSATPIPRTLYMALC
ncbi:MAG: DEAD/DEAH box helicase, partial [Verrucomicrobiae bacterium]|nr:DEAD/DEAH box helicase [Verrucomicrobiae bacterium]